MRQTPSTRARQRIDLVVMMAVQDPVGVGGRRVVPWIRAQHGRASGHWSAFQRVAEPLIVERLRAGAEVCDAVDFRRVTHEAVDRPLAAARRRRVVGRHAECRHSRVVAPQHQPDLVADDRVDVADDGLCDEVAVEERLRNPGRAS